MAVAPSKKVVIFAQDESASDCLASLYSLNCRVLGVGSGSATAIFARRCAELGFGFASEMDEDVVNGALASFKPDITVLVPAVSELPKAFTSAGKGKYIIRVGSEMKGAKWPEFRPIWLQEASSRVSIVSAGENKEVAATLVPVGKDDSALSLRAKQGEAAAVLLKALVELGEGDKLPQESSKPAPSVSEEAPQAIGLTWDEDTVDRFVRASNFPPHDPAVVEDPKSKDLYFIENMEQYQQFRIKVLEEGPGSREAFMNRTYAADTHWYSNVGGSIVKMGDSEIHMPLRVADKKHKAVIPGAALGSRKKLRMNEPLIGPNAEKYCTNALSSGWIGVEGPYVKQFEKHLARICGCAAACAVQSGTAALYGAMKALGVSDPSHHVLVPAFTCAACADSIVHLVEGLFPLTAISSRMEFL
eukprot:TRINITY_DN10150_c1_g1_i2.p1 TRINITY_DN10150_c1_g1~~TRINITY_DN10150_c1_g1_i2.p1  ORF type:complete len:417 (+),score=101.77 TRINITY_DN10150_c1_g1_i2:118-1368(+)